ncbi:hypothetical protein D3C71_1496480 [compost metagenome]
MRPVFSASWMNRSGGTAPSRGWFQRARASSASTLRSETRTTGWYTMVSSPLRSRASRKSCSSSASWRRASCIAAANTTAWLPPRLLAMYMAASEAWRRSVRPALSVCAMPTLAVRRS